MVQDVCKGVHGVELTYRCSFLTGLGTRIKKSDVASALREKLRSSRIEEIQRGTSLSGPHRDEFRILVNGVDQRFFGSHGQQKAIAIALKLAQVMLMKEKIGEWPVVLLDDLFSDFDEYHRERLVSVLANRGQLFITAQHPTQVPFALHSQARAFTVRGGQVVVG
jgi:DNA replication and repair protein RecF